MFTKISRIAHIYPKIEVIIAACGIRGAQHGKCPVYHQSNVSSLGSVPRVHTSRSSRLRIGRTVLEDRIRDFHHQLVCLLPRMRVWALAMTRNKAEAEDLAQDVAAKALAAAKTFIPGTNFPAWMHRIMMNQFISSRRRNRESSGHTQLPETPTPAAHEDHVALRELAEGLRALPAVNWQALSLVVLQDRSYEDVSATTGQPIGTLKSRVHRAREQLRPYLTGRPAKQAA